MVYSEDWISGEDSTIARFLVVGLRAAIGFTMTPSSGITELIVTKVSDFSLYGMFVVCILSVLEFLLP